MIREFKFETFELKDEKYRFGLFFIEGPTRYTIIDDTNKLMPIFKISNEMKHLLEQLDHILFCDRVLFKKENERFLFYVKFNGQ